MPGPSPGGLVVVDKPSGWTSHDVVARLRRAYGTRRVGHAGTLDPMATGVLVVGVDWCTKLLTEITGVDKTYAATIRLGVATTTDDAEGEILAAVAADGIDRQAVLAGITALTGPIPQRPSSVSAIRIDGRRAYARVRAGEDVVLPERPVTVHTFTLDALRPQATVPDRDVPVRDVPDPDVPVRDVPDPDVPVRDVPVPDVPVRDVPVLDLDVTVRCSSGTYIRALARDLGAGLGVGGHLTALRRLAVGPWTLADAVGLDELLTEPRLTDPASAAGRLLPRVVLDPATAASFRQGRRVAVPEPEPEPARSGAVAAGAGGTRRVAVLAPDGQLCGIGEWRPAGPGDPGLLVPVAVAPVADRHGVPAPRA